ncbi:MAG TPA: serine hydrolase [Vicinamibacteria bacterium]|nr:serine hydrolase [Vicinamibacteria bacterium]
MRLRLLAALLISTACARLAFAAPATRVELPRSSPEAQGIASSALLAFLQETEQKVDAVHSFMLLRHGHVVAEGWWAPYAKDDPHVLYSLSKSFTSTAVGLAIAEGRLSLDDRVLDVFPEDAPEEPSANLKAMRVRDLLAMSTGHHEEAIAGFPFDSDKSLVRLFLGLPVAHKPGTHFVYNTPATYMLSAMVQKGTGSTVLDFLRPRLFEPLGIDQPRWDADKHGISFGGFGLRIRTEDIARFGQLLLQKGSWQGRQLVPADWIAAATARQVSNGSDPRSDWEQGYGYQFWRCRHGLYRGDGAFGQFCIVMPEQDAVVAITSGTADMGAVMEQVWEHLLPAMGPAALPAAADQEAALRRKLGSLALAPQSGAASSPLAAQVSGKRYSFPQNADGVEAVALEANAGGDTLVLRRGGRETKLPVGHGRWGTTVVLPTGAAEEKAAASGGWTSDDTYTAKLCLHETPYVVTLTLHFTADELALDQQSNVAFGETRRPRLFGRR